MSGNGCVNVLNKFLPILCFHLNCKNCICIFVFIYVKIELIQVMTGSEDNLNLYLFFSLHSTSIVGNSGLYNINTLLLCKYSDYEMFSTFTVAAFNIIEYSLSAQIGGRETSGDLVSQNSSSHHLLFRMFLQINIYVGTYFIYNFCR